MTATGAVFVRCECAACDNRSAEQPEITGGDANTLNLFRECAACQRQLLNLVAEPP